MINVDISNVWGDISLPDLLGMEREVFDAHKMLEEGDGPGKEYRGWLELPARILGDGAEKLVAAAEKIREESDVCVVLGTGGGCLGARAAIELLQGPNRNLWKGTDDPQIYFAGDSFSGRQWQELEKLLDGTDFSVIVLSEEEMTAEAAVTFRSLQWMMERKYGTDETNCRIYAVAEPENSTLGRMAREQGWTCLELPENVTGRYGVLTPAGLLVMAVAGINIRELLAGAILGRDSYDLRSFENPVWLYTAVRNALYRQRKDIEILAGFEPGFRSFGAWWQQLFAGSEGKDGRGLFPVGLEYTKDLYSFDRLIRDGRKNLFETVVRFAPSEQQLTVPADSRNPEQWKALEGRTLADVEEEACWNVLQDHTDAGVSVISMDCGALSAGTLGELFYFLELACGISAYILGVNPFEPAAIRTCGE